MEDAGSYGQEKNGRIAQIVSEKKSFVVYSDTTSDAKQWVEAINECIREQSQKAHSGHYKTDSHSAAVWTPDSHAKNCSFCNDKFSFVNRRHHCRRCGKLSCSKCSKYKLPNAESVMQRACKQCYFQNNLQGGGVGGDNDSKQNGGGDHIEKQNSMSSQSQSQSIKSPKGGGNNANNNDDDSDDDDDFEDENVALHNIPYYIDIADEFGGTNEIFNKFGHGVGTYILVPADQDKASNNNGYYTVTLVVYTQTGFEQFNVSLFEKKGNIIFRLESKKLKKKDFNDINGLIAYIEKKEKLIFSYAIPRSEVELWQSSRHLQWQSSTQIDDNKKHETISSLSSIGGLENYPKAKALFDYEAEVHGDLTLRAGDIIYILDREEEDGWWTGMINNRQGLFPSTYVEIIEEKPLPSIHKNEPNEGDILIARYDYNEGGTEELAFNIGDKIILQAKDESGWWLGKLDKTGVVGWFAPDLVVPLDEQITPSFDHNDHDDNDESKTNHQTPSKASSPSSTKSPSSSKNKKIKPPKNNKNGNKSSKKSTPLKATKTSSVSSTASSASASSSVSNNTKKSSSSPSKKKNKNKKSTKKNNNKHNKDDDNKDNNGTNNGDEPSVIISYQDLKDKKWPSGVNKKSLEKHLSNKEFYQIFKCSRAEFAKRPGWKQRNMKKEHGLF